MSDKKNTIIAFVIIGLILIGFSVYNSQQSKKFQAQQFTLDSLAAEEAAERTAYLEQLRADSLEKAKTAAPVSEAVIADENVVDPAGGYYSNSFLNSALEGEEEFYTLENDKIKVVFTTRGAQFYSAQVKNYTTYDGQDLILFEGPENNFSLDFYAGEQVSSSDLFFEALPTQNPQELSFRLSLDSLAYIEYVYKLEPESFMLDMTVNMQNMDRYIRRNITQLDINWSMDVRHLEKGFDNEKNYSTVVYRYPGNKKVENLGLRKSDAKASIKTSFEWLAFQQQFFSAICIAPDSFSNGDLSYKFYDATDEQHRLMRCEAFMRIPFKALPSQSTDFQFYFGPNRFYDLKAYDRGFEKIIPLGGWVISWINRYVIIPTFNFLNKYIGNFGIIILIMTILIKLVISPLTLKSYMSTAKMRVLKPEIDRIGAKYPKKEDALKKQQETMALYKKTGVSMFGGCLPMLLQFPILFAMFRFFPASFELRQQGFLWAEDLSAYDSILDLPFKIPLYGSHVSLFALLMAITMYFYSKMNMNQTGTEQQMPGMKGMMLYFMPLMMLFVCNNLSSGLSYYYMLSNLFTMVQTWVIRRFFVDEDKLLAQLKEKSVKASPSKSKWQARLEEIQRQQEQMQKQRKK